LLVNFVHILNGDVVRFGNPISLHDAQTNPLLNGDLERVPVIKTMENPLRIVDRNARMIRILHNDADERVEFDDGERPIDVDVGGAEESDDRLQIRRRFVEIGAEQIRRRPQDPSDDDHRRLRRRIGHEM